LGFIEKCGASETFWGPPASPNDGARNIVARRIRVARENRKKDDDMPNLAGKIRHEGKPNGGNSQAWERGMGKRECRYAKDSMGKRPGKERP
jgi:hypothetical protein